MKCGECRWFLVPFEDDGVGCPICKHKDRSINTVAYPSGRDTPACEKFEPKEGRGKKRQHREAKPVYKDSGISKEGPFEAIAHEGLPAFLTKTEDGFSITDTVTCRGSTWAPKDEGRYPYEPYGYFDGDLPSVNILFSKVKHEFVNYVDFEPIWRDVLSACVMLSYQQEKLVTVPYIFLYGDNESGKSTVLQLLKALCYRPMYGVTVPAADIYGYLEDVDSIGCVLEDEVQGIRKDVDKIKIYKAGYKEGAVVPRTVITPHDRVIRYYNTFCFKACASERIPQVKGFRERFIEISMVEGFPKKEWSDLVQEDQERLHTLRNMLLKWRMASRGSPFPNPQVSMRGRLKEIWKPILQVTDGLPVYKTLADFVERQRNERLRAKQDTLEGHIVKVVTKLANEARESQLSYLPFHTIWFTLATDLDGRIDERKPHVMDTSEFFMVTKNKVGYRLREVLSGKSKPIREKNSVGNNTVVKAYFFEREKLRRIAKKYGYELVTKLPTKPSCQGINPLIPTSKRKEDNVERGLLIGPQVGLLGYTVTTCPHCREPLPSDLADCVIDAEEGKTVHRSCAERMRAGRSRE